MKNIIVIGPFPPPVYGSSKNLKIVADTLEKNTHITRICISPGSIVRSKQYHIKKLTKVIKGLSKLFISGIRSNSPTVYMPPDAGMGMYYTLLFVTLARLLKLNIFLHHRSFAYINYRNKVMQMLVNMAGKDAVHIFLCQNMENQFRSLYEQDFRSLVVSNAQHVQPISIEKTKPLHNTFVMGHLSNLGVEKGLKDVIELTEKLLKEGHAVKLILAGPVENKLAQSVLDNAISKLGQHLEYRGYVNHSDKQAFFGDIDLFLFPSRYRNEAQPNVIFEANAHAVPVITLKRGCISSDVNIANGIVLDPDKHFASEAYPIIVQWLMSPDEYMRLKRSTLSKITEAGLQAEHAFKQMIEAIENA